MPKQPRLTAFLSELRRRRVFRVAAFYGGIVFVIIQIIDGTFEVMGIPAWVSRLVIILLSLGFPVSMILAWVFDITPEGIVRTKGRPADAQRKAQPLIGNRALAIIAVVAVAFGIWGQWESPVDRSIIRSVAVLPLANMMNDSDQQYFVDGMHEAMITALSRLHDLRVISRTSVLGYRDNSKPMHVIADELNVDAVIEGSVLWSEGKVRITAQLIGTRPERHIWAEEYTRDLRNILGLHSDVAQSVAQSIQITLTSDEKRELQTWTPVNPAAYKLYLKGLQSIGSFSIEGYKAGQSAFQQAIEIKTDYADAYTGLALANYYLAADGEAPPRKLMPIAKLSSLKAIELDPLQAEAFLILGMIAIEYDYDVEAAGGYMRKGLEINPSLVRGRQWFAQYLLLTGRRVQSFDELRLAISLDPLSEIPQLFLAFHYVLDGQYEAAIQTIENFPTATQSTGFALELLTSSYSGAGQHHQAMQLYDKSFSPQIDGWLWNSIFYFHSLSETGNLDALRLQIVKVLERRKIAHVDPYIIACAYASLGEIDSSLSWLETAFDERSWHLIWLNHIPVFNDAVRRDPRYQAILTKLGFD